MGWSELIGEHLDQYQIIAEIARGGMSRVYRAVEDGNGRDTAIKVMVLGGDGGDQSPFVRRFEHEAEAVERLDHPNIVKVYGAGRTEEFVYIAMQLVMGGTYRQLLGHPMPVSEACSYMIQMAKALHHAHMHNVIHRDVKPANMLIDAIDQNHLLLADFGIAKIMGQKGVTKTGTAVGTPEYMAPEQAKGEEIDPRADIYGLACVLYESLAGRPPFVGPTALSICYQHVHTRPAYIRGFNPEVPRALALVIEQALAKNPRDRFPSAEAFAAALFPFTEPSGQFVRRVGTAVANRSDIADIRESLPGSMRDPAVALPPMATYASALDQPPPSIPYAELDLSTLPEIPQRNSQPLQDDTTTRQTQEMVPMAVPARPRHSRPMQPPGLSLKSRSVTSPRPITHPQHTPTTDPSAFSTIQTPIPPDLPPSSTGKGMALPSGRRTTALIVAILVVVTLVAAVFVNQHRDGPRPSPTAQATSTNTTLPTVAATPSATITGTATTGTTPVATATQSVSVAQIVVENLIIGIAADYGFSTTPGVDNVRTTYSVGDHLYVSGNLKAGYSGKFGAKLTQSSSGTIVAEYHIYPTAVGGAQSFDVTNAISGGLPQGTFTLIVTWNDENVRSHTYTITVS
jgi:serine/threonine protein kinase